jgi:hypothetical protein
MTAMIATNDRDLTLDGKEILRVGHREVFRGMGVASFLILLPLLCLGPAKRQLKDKG